MNFRKIVYFYPEANAVSIQNYNTEITVISQDGKAFNVYHIILNKNGEHFRPSLNKMSVSNPLDAETYLEELFKIYKERHSDGFWFDVDCKIKVFEEAVKEHLAQSRIENLLDYPTTKYKYWMKVGNPYHNYVNGFVYQAWENKNHGVLMVNDLNCSEFIYNRDLNKYFTNEFDI